MITFSKRTISINGKLIELQYPIADAFELEDRIIVLFDPDAYAEKFGQFPNLIAIGLGGEHLWTTELPTSTSGDRYYKITTKIPLIVCSIYSYECEIDTLTGRIKARNFFK